MLVRVMGPVIELKDCVAEKESKNGRCLLFTPAARARRELSCGDTLRQRC
jgi:hypothetical protein